MTIKSKSIFTIFNKAIQDKRMSELKSKVNLVQVQIKSQNIE